MLFAFSFIHLPVYQSKWLLCKKQQHFCSCSFERIQQHFFFDSDHLSCFETQKLLFVNSFIDWSFALFGDKMFSVWLKRNYFILWNSKTFLDTTMERNTLMAKCYPRIKDYCREKHGLEFQVKMGSIIFWRIFRWFYDSFRWICEIGAKNPKSMTQFAF